MRTKGATGYASRTNAEDKGKKKSAVGVKMAEQWKISLGVINKQKEQGEEHSV